MAAVTVQQEQAPRPLPSLEVLVVDDEPGLCKVLAALLEIDGHRVRSVGRAEDALTELERRPADVVFCDLALGAGISGWQFAELARQRYPRTRIVLTTGFGAQVNPHEARSQGIQAVLPKPFRLADLRAALLAATSDSTLAA